MSAQDMLNKPCFGCPFTADSLVSPARVKDIVDRLKRTDGYFICHKSADGPTRIERLPEGMTCRGFHDKVHLKDGTGNLLRIIGRLGGFTEHTLTPEEEAEARTNLTPHKKQGQWREGRKFLGTHACSCCAKKVRVYDWLPTAVLCAKCAKQVRTEESTMEER